MRARQASDSPAGTAAAVDGIEDPAPGVLGREPGSREPLASPRPRRRGWTESTRTVGVRLRTKHFVILRRYRYRYKPDPSGLPPTQCRGPCGAVPASLLTIIGARAKKGRGVELRWLSLGRSQIAVADAFPGGGRSVGLHIWRRANGSQRNCSMLASSQWPPFGERDDPPCHSPGGHDSPSWSSVAKTKL